MVLVVYADVLRHKLFSKASSFCRFENGIFCSINENLLLFLNWLNSPLINLCIIYAIYFRSACWRNDLLSAGIHDKISFWFWLCSGQYLGWNFMWEIAVHTLLVIYKYSLNFIVIISMRVSLPREKLRAEKRERRIFTRILSVIAQTCFSPNKAISKISCVLRRWQNKDSWKECYFYLDRKISSLTAAESSII